MRITLASVTVNDQAHARRFYTEVANSFESLDIQAEYARLQAKGVVFRTLPTPAGPAVFDDTCGNLIQLH